MSRGDFIFLLVIFVVENNWQEVFFVLTVLRFLCVLKKLVTWRVMIGQGIITV